MSRRPDEQMVNRMLMQNGLGTLDDPGLVQQLGFLFSKILTTHETLREALNRCTPANRRDMLEVLKPYLRFEVKPLDVYLAELAGIAEAKQVPLLAPDGTLIPYKVPVIQTTEPESDLDVANRAVREAIASERLYVVCRRCTHDATIVGWDKRAAVEQLRALGWIYNELTDTELCPKCSGVKLAA